MLFRKMLKFAFFAILCLVVLSACDENEHDGGQNDEIQTLTLSVLAPHMYYSVIRATEMDMQLQFMQQSENTRFEIELTTYGADPLRNIEEMQHHRARLNTMLMAGQAYDVVFWDSHSFRAYADAGFLIDFYDLMDRHPSTSREDFHTNVLETFEHNGGLYVFPLSFGLEYVGINSRLPKSIVDDFVWRDSITIVELMQIYHALQRDYASEFGHMYLINGNASYFWYKNSPLVAVANQFIDFNSRTSNLNSNEFIDFLELWRELSDTTDSFVYFTHLDTVPRVETMALKHMNCVFASFGSALNPVTALFSAESTQFLNIIPLVDDDGRFLLMNNHPHLGGSSWAKIMLPAVGDGMLAWEFVQNLIPIITNTETQMLMGSNSLATPITRADFEPHFERTIYRLFEDSSFWMIPFEETNDVESRGHATNAAMHRLANYHEMPLAIFEINLWNAPDLFMDESLINHFLLGLSRADELAAELHNRMSLWLIE